VVTVRKAGRSTTIAAGDNLAVDDLAALAAGQAVARHPAGTDPPAGRPGGGNGASPGGNADSDSPPASSLRESVARCQATFDEALGQRSVPGAVKAILELDDEIVMWSRDTLQSDEADQARATLRGMIVRLGQLAEVGAVDRRDVVGPFVEALLDVRATARADKRWTDADTVRDRIVALGVEVRDGPGGTDWDLGPPA
jgi:cysteinyl-tRNA synthetase